MQRIIANFLAKNIRKKESSKCFPKEIHYKRFWMRKCKNATKASKNYLGTSLIRDECLRKIQLQYQGNRSNVSSQTLRTFGIGHCLEDLVAEWMRIAGFDLKTRNENGEQFGFSVASGKLQGHVDGIIADISEDLQGIGFKCPILWECKTLHSKSWSETAKRGLWYIRFGKHSLFSFSSRSGLCALSRI